jgi:hypothetical protein
MGTSSGSDSGSSGAVTADYYGPDSSLVDEVALTGGDSGAVTADYYGGDSVTTPTSVGGTDIDATYTTGTEFDVTPTQEPTFGESLTDYIQGGGLIGAGIRTVSDIFGTPENQYAGITGEDGYGEGDYVSTLDDFAESRGLGSDYSSLDLESQAIVDKAAFDAGYRSPAFQELYQTGDVSNLQNLSQPESEEVRRLIPQASYVVGGQQPIESQVNKYFANLGSQSGLSSQLESDYNAAKANVANTLSITPLAQQFGYSEQPYGALTATNLGTNPFNIPYLQTRGLI